MITYFKYIISGIFVVFISCELSEKEIIEKNTFLIESIDPNEDDFRDLEFLKEILSDKKVLFLGESAHGDGSTFQAKIRLIKFLHEDLNYKLIAFEGATITDFYELNASKRKHRCSYNYSSNSIPLHHRKKNNLSRNSYINRKTHLRQHRKSARTH